MELLGWWKRFRVLDHILEKLRYKTHLAKSLPTAPKPGPLEGAGRGSLPEQALCLFSHPHVALAASSAPQRDYESATAESEWGWRLDHLCWGSRGPSVPSPAQVT